MEAITISPMLYVLRLEDECYYIGMTMNANLRWAQHWNQQGAKWTKLHKPIEVVKVVYPASIEMENIVTKEYKQMYGDDAVRGGSFCKV